MNHVTVDQEKNINTVVVLYKKETINITINKIDPAM
jgi:hypothetical protein